MSLDALPIRSNREIFRATLAITDEQDRQAFLEQACGNDLERRRNLQRLLAVHDRGVANLASQATGRFGPTEQTINRTQGAATEAGTAPSDDLSDHPLIGRYQLVQQIGEGGMGTVFMAQQTEPIQRLVALKLIKPGLASHDVIARFQSERQALAMMDHPNIAHVLDAGTTTDGRPYFVMELVHGVPITTFCDRSELPIAERLRLFIDVCQAVQHAHQKAVIHRDLKPSNVMVTLHDGKPVVKVIDFGLAKAIDQELGDRSVFTQFAQIVGTPLYMSPEQAELSGLDVDTRSDIYSLGVLLYELLTGNTPFDKQVLSKASFNGMRRIICEQEPPRPSQRISMLPADLLATVADDRQVDPGQLSLSMRRELDWIVMKALEKDRSRRYESASMFAADVQRYLDDQPVHACPPSALYRLRKLTRRHKGMLSAAVLVVCLMLIGLVVSSKLAIRASNAESAARIAQAEAERTAEEMRHLLYTSDVMLASQASQHDDVQQARERLSRHIPKPGQRDLRGFEWHYLWKQQEVAGVEIASVGSAIYDIALSPDGKRLAVTGADATIRLFHAASGAPWLSIPTHQGETNGVTFSPDSQALAATGDDGSVRVWDLDTQQQRWTASAHQGLAFEVVYSADGKTLATCGAADRVQLWDASSGAPLGTLNEHTAQLETLAISPQGLVAAGDRHSRVSLWDMKKGQLVWSPSEGVMDPTSSLAFSDHGFLAQGTIGGLLTVFHAGTRAVASQRRFANGIQSLAFAPQGAWMAVGDRAGHLRIVPFERGAWDLRSSREWPAHDGRVYSVQVTPDGKRLFSGGADGRLMLWEPFAGAPQQTVRFQQPYLRIHSLTGGRFLISGQDRLLICDQNGAVLRELQPEGRWRTEVAASAPWVFGISDTRLAAWNLQSGEQRYDRPLPEGLEIVELAVSPDAGTVCLTAMFPDGSRQLQIIDVASDSLVTQFDVRSANWLAISPEGRWLAFDAENDIQFYDLKNHRLGCRARGHQGAIRQLAFSHDGQRLGSVSADRTLKLWSVPSGTLEYSVIAHRNDSLRLALAPDGKRIATVGEDRMLRLWDGRSNEPLWEYPIAAGQAHGLCFSQDGERLLCLCNDHNVQILDGSPNIDSPDQ